jgi:hypothetical protein
VKQLEDIARRCSIGARGLRCVFKNQGRMLIEQELLRPPEHLKLRALDVDLDKVNS